MNKLEGFNINNVDKKSIDPEIIKIVEGYFELMILESSKVNEGNNGVIKKFSINSLPKDIRDLLKEINPSFFSEKDDFAIKLLKIYTNGKGRDEYEAQKNAYNITKDLDSNKFAMVPEIIFYGELEIKDQKVKEKLQSENVDVLNNRVEIMIMDFINADDMATVLYKEVLRRALKNPRYSERMLIKEDDIENLRIDDLIFEVSHILDFNKPGGKHSDQNLKIYEEEKVKRDNFVKIFNFLEKEEYVLDKNILTRLENTINIFHKNNLYHRDLHERNVLITKDNTYIIDFGSAVDPRTITGEIYEEDGNKRINDKAITETYSRLTETKEEKEGNKKLDYIKSLDSIKKKIFKKRENDFNKIIEMSIKTPGESFRLIEELLLNLGLNKSDSMYYDAKAMLLIEISENCPNEIKDSLAKEISDPTNSQFAQNYYRKLHGLI